METRPDAVDMHPASVRNDAHERQEIARVVYATITSACHNHMITTKQSARYHLLFEYLIGCTEVSIVLLNRPWPVECIWPVSKILVHDALIFSEYIQRMVANDTSGLFHVDRVVYPRASPTYIVGHSLCSLGMKQRFRGPPSTDPGSSEHMYYKMWTFQNDRSFQNWCAQNLRCDVTSHVRRVNAELAERTDAEIRMILATFN